MINQVPQNRIHDFCVRLSARSTFVRDKGMIPSEVGPRWFVITDSQKKGNVMQIIREQFAKDNLLENRDWFLFSSGDPTPNAIYNLLYDHNGKILVLENYYELLKGEERYLFWKHLFEDPSYDYPEIGVPNPDKGLYYKVNTLSSKERDFAEKNGTRPDRFKFTGCVILLTKAKNRYDFYVTENQIPEDYRCSLMQRAKIYEF